ncbi:uncharacterized protein Bfra_004705 [Botrytis fragariae]|uniref:Uncharacterized protein n=1 Tax=Botrytis fragariae TaxID=1964551 RepID=A0A8H6AWI3_9HELO|nr:uncharacterized protein Bfra_004705 [Botrytis fragariae]KAF5874690.1 hypothetical protein Bfra_004705 [Botrytis fragariae]
MASSQRSLGQSEGSDGKIVGWAQESESEVVELANTSEKDWSERDLSELGENMMRTLARAIDPVLLSLVLEYYLNASQSATTAPLSVGKIPSNPLAHPIHSPKVGSQLGLLTLTALMNWNIPKFALTTSMTAKTEMIQFRGTKIAASDTLKRTYSTLEKPDTKLKLSEKNSKAKARSLKNLPPKEFKVPPTRSALPRSRKSTSFQPESDFPESQEARSYTYRREKIVASLKTLKLIITSSDKADATRYEVVDSEWALSEFTLFRVIVYDKPYPIEQPDRLKIVIRDEDAITVKWNEVIGDYARRSKPPALVIQSWGLDSVFKALGL